MNQGTTVPLRFQVTVRYVLFMEKRYSVAMPMFVRIDNELTQSLVSYL
jgi:hypothetical protein